MKRDVVVGRSVTIPAGEIDLTFSTSGGPGGQHANKNATRVELRWNIVTSNALGPRQRARLLDRLSSRIDSQGFLHLSAGRRRSQLRNIDDALDRLRDIVEEALKVQPQRVGTKPSQGAVRRRLDSKRRRSDIKRLRRSPAGDD